MGRVTLLATAAAVLALVALALLVPPMRSPATSRVDWNALAAGPTSKVATYWVGHSLMNARDPHVEGARNLLERVGDFARSQGLAYEAFDHTLYGSPLSLLWRGRPHGYDRREPQMVERLDTLLREGARFDALVLTEGIPVERSMQREHSAYYAQQFQRALLERNPQARVYVYESWTHLDASDEECEYPPASVFDWSARLADDRAHWERLADLAATGAMPAPGWLSRLKRWQATAPVHPRPLFLVPVGSVLRRLAQQPERFTFEGRPLRRSDLFANAYVDWPVGWPLEQPLPPAQERAELAKLAKRHPAEPLDDVHPSDLGVYLASLTHFATLYRRTPVGLPNDVAGLDDASARALQELVWDVVRNDPRTGVASR